MCKKSEEISLVVLSECDVDERYHYRVWVEEFCRGHGDAEDELSVFLRTTNFVYSVFDERIIPALILFTLLDFGYEKGKKEDIVKRGWRIEWFAITNFGKKIFEGMKQNSKI